MQAVVRPGQRVLLKPNLLGPFAVERAVTTHPAVVRAAIRLVQEAGGRAFVGDSSALGQLAGVARACGLAPVLAETGAELLDFSEAQEFDVPGHTVSPRLVLAKALSQVDVVITLPKLKTHGQMILTAALKNQYGCIPGALKSQWHFRLQQPEWLASLILDVNRVVRPSLAILDAVTAMEGAGPTSGQPRQLGALLAGSDLAAVDTLACHLIGLDPLSVPLMAAAREQAFGQTRLEQIQVFGPDWRTLAVRDFKKVEQPVAVLRLLPLPKPVLEWLRRQWTLRPEIIDGRCTQCGICENGCPVKPSAIHPKAAPAERLDDSRCIRCYCCHEFCPSHGIELRAPWLARHLPLEKLANGTSRFVGVFASFRRPRS
jgi:uncharacterized protein (DUF362 family)/NAD-dependent dihydropyrimidine dehydrogenase PreA subunit